jgi:hypothetical protein
MIGTLLVGIAIVCLYLHQKRKFDRTNPGGLEQFSSYPAKLRAKVADWGLLTLSLVTAVMGVMLLATQYQDSWGGWVLGIVYGWLAIGYWPLQKHRR